MQTDHEELARRVETEQPSRELDCEIVQSIGYTLRVPNENELPCRFADHRRWYDGEGLPVGWMEGACEFPAGYTTSVDAALSLVPEGWSLELHQQDSGWAANLKRGYCTSYDKVIFSERGPNGWPPTPAQAITAAALRALKEAK